jgi:hypothetical protein
MRFTENALIRDTMSLLTNNLKLKLKFIFKLRNFKNMTSLITGRIYIIRSPNTEMVYVGSTILTLKQRFIIHISGWRYNQHCSSHLVLEKGEAYIELIEEVKIESERELDMLEQQWIDNTPNTVNKKRAYRSEEERLQTHRDCNRKYREVHAEKITEMRKKYQKEHREEIAEKQKKYQKEHREERNKKQREQVLCEVCGCYVTRGSKSKHMSTAKHARNLKNHLQNVDQE